MMCSSMAAPDNLTNSERPFQTAFLLRFEVDFRFSSTFHIKIYHSTGRFLEWYIIQKVIRASPHSAPSATASKVSFPFHTNTDPIPTIYRLHKTDQFRTVGKCTGIQWHPRHFSASNMGSIQCLSAYTAHSAMIHPFSPNMNLMTRCEKRISVHHKAQHIFCLHTRFREDTSQ